MVFVSIISGASWAQAQDNTGLLSIESIKPMVDAHTIQLWLQDLFESDSEILPIKNPTQFLKTMSESGLDPQILSELHDAIKNNLSFHEMSKILLFYNPINVHDYLYLSPTLKQKMSSESLSALYTYLLKTNLPPPNLIFDRKKQIEKYFQQEGIDSETSKQLLRQVLYFDESYYFFLTPENWQMLTPNMRLIEIKEFLRQHANGSLDLNLTINQNDNLKAIAKKYSGANDPQEIESYLKKIMAENSNSQFTIPLQNILNPFIKKHVHRFSNYAGENCFRCGIMANIENWIEANQLIDRKRLMNLTYQNYRFVQPKEKLQTGDLLIYFDEHGFAKHVSSYVIDDIIFTKNGTTKFTPYVFQHKKQNELIYFKNGRFSLSVFRPTKKDTEAISPNGYESFKGEKVYYENNLNKQPQNQCRNIYKS